MAEVWAAGGASTATSTLTTTLNSTAKDRLLVIHVAPASAAIAVTFDDGSKKLANATPVGANQPRDFGPFFLPSGTNLRGGTAAGSDADFRIDELDVNQ